MYTVPPHFPGSMTIDGPAIGIVARELAQTRYCGSRSGRATKVEGSSPISPISLDPWPVGGEGRKEIRIEEGRRIAFARRWESTGNTYNDMTSTIRRRGNKCDKNDNNNDKSSLVRPLRFSPSPSPPLPPPPRPRSLLPLLYKCTNIYTIDIMTKLEGAFERVLKPGYPWARATPVAFGTSQFFRPRATPADLIGTRRAAGVRGSA